MARSALPSSAPAGLGPINIATPGLSPGANLCRNSGASYASSLLLSL